MVKRLYAVFRTISSTIGSTFYDYLEVCNPLRSKAKVHKLSKTGLRWMKYECKGLAGNPYKNGYVQHVCCAYGAVNAARASCTYVQNMCKLLPYLLYAQHVCYLCTRHALLAHMHATGMLHMCLLHVCILLQCCIYAACTHASY